MIEVQLWNKTTQVYHKVKYATTLPQKIIVVQGGGQAGKTIAILQVICDLLVENPRMVATVFGMTYDHLDRGALRDFKDLVRDNVLLRMCIKNPGAERGAYKFKNGSIIEFIALDKPIKGLGAKRHISYFNEANGLSYETFRNVNLRTTFKFFCDYNPTAKFWIHTKIIPFKKECISFIVNFAHNEFCPEEARLELKSYFVKWKLTGLKYWENLWKVFGLGKTGIPEGTVFPNIEIVESFPKLSELKYFGYAIDFGFSVDPLVIAKCGIRHNGRFVGQQMHYSPMSAYLLDELMPRIGINKTDPIIADPENGDAIDYLTKKGWNIIYADKPPGSVKQGIELLNHSGIEIVQGSVDWLIEQSKYVYKVIMGDISKNEPIDKYNHLWDCARYFARWAILHKGINPRKGKRGNRSFESY